MPGRAHSTSSTSYNPPIHKDAGDDAKHSAKPDAPNQRAHPGLQTASGYLTIFIMVFAPVFALARVIEWWVNTHRRFSIFWQEQENQE